MNSSDCVANENEWSDSEGKRVRSSPKAKVGDPGTEGAASEGCRDTGGVLMLSEVLRWVEGSCLGAGCRIRRNPDVREPCSCSGTMGDLVIRSSWPASKLMRLAVSIIGGAEMVCESRFDMLLFLVSETWSVVSRCVGRAPKWCSRSSGREPGGVA